MKISFWKAIKLCIFLIFAPKTFIKIEEEHKIQQKDGKINEEHNAYIVRRAFWCSLLLVIGSGILGGGLGSLLNLLELYSKQNAIFLLQIVGALLLLWGTLFIRGWEIESYGGITLTEKVNQWVYRTFYLVGTATIVFSLTWKPYH